MNVEVEMQVQVQINVQVQMNVQVQVQYLVEGHGCRPNRHPVPRPIGIRGFTPVNLWMTWRENMITTIGAKPNLYSDNNN